MYEFFGENLLFYIYKSFKTILLFVIMIMLSEKIAGDEFTYKMCIVILCSMLILNGDIIVNGLEAVSNTLTNN